MNTQNATPQTINNFKLVNIEMYPSRNGYTLDATLLMNGDFVCDIEDKGDGSLPILRKVNQPVLDKIISALEQLPPQFIDSYGCELKVDIYLFIDLLNYAQETKTEFKLLAA